MSTLARALLNPWVVFVVGAILWSVEPYLMQDYFVRTQALGYYPPHADSIAIGIVNSFMLALVGAPFFAALLWLLLRRSVPERRRWLVWSSDRWGWSTVWTVIFVGLSILCLESFVEEIRLDLPRGAAASLVWCAFWLAMRAVVVSRLRPSSGQTIPAMPALE